MKFIFPARRRRRANRSYSSLSVVLVAAVLVVSGACARAGTTADSVVDYTPGDLSRFPNSSFNLPASALGPLNGDTTAGGLNPFNPPFDPSQIVIAGAGGQITLHLSSEVPANGRTLGVFANNGLIDVSADGSGQAASPPGTFSAPPQAVISVSQDGTHYITLNAGAPIMLSNPTNYWLDQPISNYNQNLGTLAANPSKPFLGTLASFSGQTYSQIKTTLNGSAGGTWIDLSGSGLPAVNYVRLSNPTGSSFRTVVDAITGMSAAKPIVAGQPIISESVGGGANTSHVVLDFGPQSYEFDVHYDGSITGEQALQLLQADSAFRFTAQTFSIGDLINGMDYGGYVNTNAGSNFWKYYLSTDGQTWSSSDVGASGRTLTDGAWDGWVWTGAQSSAPDLPIAAPEPGTLGLLGIGLLLLLQRRRRRVSGTSFGTCV